LHKTRSEDLLDFFYCIVRPRKQILFGSLGSIYSGRQNPKRSVIFGIWQSVFTGDKTL
jgi:hypothetical protein